MSGILSLSNRNKILKQDNVEAFNKRIRECKYPDLERMLWLWQTMVTNKGVSVSDALLIEKAKEFGQMVFLKARHLCTHKVGLKNSKIGII